MKIAIAQINPTVGDLEFNFKLIVENVKKAREAKVDLLVFPELALLGYPPKDLLLKPGFLEKQSYYLNELKLYTDKDLAILIGAATENKTGFGKKLHNSLIFFHEGEEKLIGSKTLLPNYDVFDETRYFEPAQKPSVLEYKGIKLGLSICEDIWMEAYPLMYQRDPIAEMIANGAEIVINSAASPFVSDKPQRRAKLISNMVKRFKTPVVYLNQVGANDQLIFDGGSLVFDKDAKLLKRLKDFEEDFHVFDSKELLESKCESQSEAEIYKSLESTDLKSSIEETNNINLQSIRKALVLGIKDYVRKSGFSKVILGLSGGIDSALVATLAAEAVGPENVHAIGMPSTHSSKGSIDHSEELAKNLGIKFQIISIKDLYEDMRKIIPDISELADENLQPRLRANVLMTMSNSMNALLLNTGNKSELAVGYCTMYGDTCGGLSVIGDLLKTTVYKLANFINEEAKKEGKGEVIPQSIIDKAPSAELKPNQKDEDTLPPYEILDQIALLYVQEMKTIEEIMEEGFEADTVVDILNMIDRSEYKRQQAPPCLKIAGKAFGLGRRMPIAQGFKHKLSHA